MDPIVKYKAKFLEDINIQKTDALISFELCILIDGVCA